MGYHSATMHFNGECFDLPDGVSHRCQSPAPDMALKETGPVAGLYWHAVGAGVSSGGASGPRKTDVSCAGGGLFSVQKCLMGISCAISPSVSVSLSGTGGGVTATASYTNGGNVWNDAHAESFTCAKEDTQVGDAPPPPDSDPPASSGSCLSATTIQVVVVDGVQYDACYSPILIDVDGDGLNLTDAKGGVAFDLDGDGVKDHLAWTMAGSDDGFLALDRNGDGTIDDGRELFGNFTPQQPSPTPNGFIALADLDTNRDGVVDARDLDFGKLLLWQDSNHDGISQPSEIHHLAEVGIETLHLNYKSSKWIDANGNAFRYRAKVDSARGSDVARWAWDVFFAHLK
jgi:hypothetical protein